MTNGTIASRRWGVVLLALIVSSCRRDDGAVESRREASTAVPNLYVLAGIPSGMGSADGTGSDARFLSPASVAVDVHGNVYVVDRYNGTIRKATSEGVVTTLAGTAGSYGSADGAGAAAQFENPNGVAVDGSGNVYVADKQAHTIRKITPGGVVTTLAGSAGSYGAIDGIGTAARFNHPSGVAVDAAGNVYVADQWNYTIRKVTPEGLVTTLAGRIGTYGSADGTGSAARFDEPMDVAVDGTGNVYVADYWNDTIRKVTPDGVVTTLAGSPGFRGTADGTGSDALFWLPTNVGADSSGNVYVADYWNHTIRKISPDGVVTTIAGSVHQRGYVDGPGSAAGFDCPEDVAADGAGNLYVADGGNSAIRKMNRPGFSGGSDA